MAVALLAVLCLPASLKAQIDRGEITGTVQDPSGAVVQNAKIVLTNDDTSVSISTNSTQTGTYVFEGVIPGKYTVEAQTAGFEKYVVHGIYVHVQQVLTEDVHFAAGNVEQSVSVTASAPLLEAENAAVGRLTTGECGTNYGARQNASVQIFDTRARTNAPPSILVSQTLRVVRSM